MCKRNTENQAIKPIPYQQCTRCVMDNIGDNTITFNKEGYCNYCCQAIEFKEQRYWPEDNGQKLDAIMKKIKEDGKGQKYDCIVGVSGGLDSSYVIYLGYQYGLRMLGVHFDDNLDTDIAKDNVKNLCDRANVKLINVQPNMQQYKDLTLAFLKSGVPNLAIPQDNLILSALNDSIKKHNLKYLLNGSNYALECILQEDNKYTPADCTQIRDIYKHYGTGHIDDLRFITTFENSILKRLRKDIIKICPLNYIEYTMKKAIDDLHSFSGFVYYGGKHYESILTRFMQCYYLPTFFNVNKKKSHLSSMIISGQLSREEALCLLALPLYPPELKDFDFNYLANYLGLTLAEFENLLENLQVHSHDDFKKSILSNKIIPFLLRHRKLLRIK